MDVLRHDREAVQLELALFPISEDRLQKQVGMGGLLKVAKLKKGRDGEGVCFALLLC